jgi:cytochrome oxidase assembly protein ShyY1
VKNWRFAFQKRWFGYLAMAIVFAIACVLLSNWQFDRRMEAREEIDRITVNYARPVEPVESVLPTLDTFDEDDKWSPVTMTGTYIVDEQLLVRNRPHSGNPGFEVLTPLRLTNGTIFVVDRGWVPSGSKQDYPDEIPEAPTGEVTVVARLKAGEPELRGRSAPEGQIATVHLEDIANRVGGPTYTGAYGLMDSESPAPPERPLAAIKPALDEGPHLSYAVQWIIFAFFGFGGLAYALRQEFRIVNADDPEEQARAEVRRRRDEARPRTDAEIEDQLLDANR